MGRRVSSSAMKVKKLRTGVPDLEVLESGVTGVLDVVAEGRGDVADVAGLVVERDCVAGGREERHATGAGQEVTPLILGGVPL